MPNFFEKIGREVARVRQQAREAIEENKIEREVKRIGHQIESAARNIKAGYQGFNQQSREENPQCVSTEVSNTLTNNMASLASVQGPVTFTVAQTEPVLACGQSASSGQALYNPN